MTGKASLLIDKKHILLISGMLDEAVEVGRLLDVMWEADMRAIKIWQDETGNSLVWPDRSKHTEWMIRRNALVKPNPAAIGELIEKANRHLDTIREAKKIVSEYCHSESIEDGHLQHGLEDIEQALAALNGEG